VTFVRRLTRDLRERRKPPWTLVRRGLALMRDEPAVIRRQEELGAQPARARDLEPTLSAMAA
jgi:uridine kinase